MSQHILNETNVNKRSLGTKILITTQDDIIKLNLIAPKQLYAPSANHHVAFSVEVNSSYMNNIPSVPRIYYDFLFSFIFIKGNPD